MGDEDVVRGETRGEKQDKKIRLRMWFALYKRTMKGRRRCGFVKAVWLQKKREEKECEVWVCVGGTLTRPGPPPCCWLQVVIACGRGGACCTVRKGH